MGIEADVTTPRTGSDPLPDPAEASTEELKAKARELKIEGRSKMGQEELIEAIAEADQGEHR